MRDLMILFALLALVGVMSMTFSSMAEDIASCSPEEWTCLGGNCSATTPCSEKGICDPDSCPAYENGCCNGAPCKVGGVCDPENCPAYQKGYCK
jgi:hypothetical protein